MTYTPPLSSLLVIASSLHSGVIGTDDMPVDHAGMSSALRAHLADWSPSASPYDAAVLLLCSEALREYEYWASVGREPWL